MSNPSPTGKSFHCDPRASSPSIRHFLSTPRLSRSLTRVSSAAITNSWDSSSNSIRPKSYSIRASRKYTSATMMPGWRTLEKQALIRLRSSMVSSTKPSKIAVRDTRYSASCVPFFRRFPMGQLTSFFDDPQPVGVLYRPSENKLRNAKQKDYLGKAVSNRAPSL